MPQTVGVFLQFIIPDTTTKYSKIKTCPIWGAAIAQWIRLCLPICHPRFESHAHHLCFYQFILNLCHVEKTKVCKKRAGLSHLFIKILSYFLIEGFFLIEHFGWQRQQQTFGVKIFSLENLFFWHKKLQTSLINLHRLKVNATDGFSHTKGLIDRWSVQIIFYCRMSVM